MFTSTKYSTYDRELLAVYLAIKHFHHFVEGCTFEVFTDHKPLNYSLSSAADKYTPQQTQFTTNIAHVNGSENPVADALSLVTTNAISLPVTIDLAEIAHAQKNDTELTQLTESNSSLTLKEVPVPTADVTMVCDISTGTPRPYIPPQFRHRIFELLHSLSHPGIRATQ